MEIKPYTAEMLDELTQVYNRAITGLPHCFPVDAATFGRGVAAAVKAGPGNELCDAEVVLVSTDSGRINGFVHAGTGRINKEDEARTGVIRFLWYDRGCRDAGRRLLEAAEAWIRKAGMTGVIACLNRHMYSFYHLPPAFMSDRLGHVEALLAINGYERTHGEVVFNWPAFDPPEPRPLDDGTGIELEWPQGKGPLPGLKVKGLRDGVPIGVCDCIAFPDFTPGGEEADWFFVSWLGVDAPYQGRYVGRYLLGRALVELKQAGYQHGCITTALRNHRAALFYSNIGFQVVDWTYGYSKTLGTGKEA